MLLSELFEKIKGTKIIVSIDNKTGIEETFKVIIDMAK